MDAVQIDDARELYAPLLQAIDGARARVHDQMVAIAEAFWAERTKAIEAERRRPSEGGKPCYIAITLSVRNQRGTSEARWIDIHSRNGGATGKAARRTNKGTGEYHLQSLKEGVPEHLHEAIVEAELKLRILRKRQKKLGLMRRSLQEKPAQAAAPPPPDLTGLNWDWAKPPLE